MLFRYSTEHNALRVLRQIADAMAMQNMREGTQTVCLSVPGSQIHSCELHKRVKLLSCNDNICVIVIATDLEDVAPFSSAMYHHLTRDSNEAMTQRSFERLLGVAGATLLLPSRHDACLSPYLLSRCTVIDDRAAVLDCRSYWSCD